MRLLHWDLWTGLAGDMWVGALLDAGWPEARLRDVTRALGIADDAVRVERRVHSGLSGLGIRVRGEHDAPHTHEHAHAHDHDHPHHHDHDHAHEAERGYAEIVALVRAASFGEPATARIIETFRVLGEAEARIHAIPLEQVHFHEVGALDSIVDVCASVVALADLGIEAVTCGPIPIGGGEIRMAHGRIPAPAPATSLLLEGWPLRPAESPGEWTTPTAAALLRALARPVASIPDLLVERVGFGAGTKSHPRLPNLVRAWIGREAPRAGAPEGADLDLVLRTVSVLETQVDDVEPRVLSAAADRLLERGALDVFRAAVQMKKGRQGVLITVVAPVEREAALAAELSAATGSLGIRARLERRWERRRWTAEVASPWGPLRIKQSVLGGETHSTVEFDAARELADHLGVPVRELLPRLEAWLADAAGRMQVGPAVPPRSTRTNS